MSETPLVSSPRPSFLVASGDQVGYPWAWQGGLAYQLDQVPATADQLRTRNLQVTRLHTLSVDVGEGIGSRREGRSEGESMALSRVHGPLSRPS